MDTKGTMRTFRFAAFLVTMIALMGVSFYAMIIHADTATTVGILSAVAGFGGAYQGFGNWHDQKVRTALAPSTPPT